MERDFQRQLNLNEADRPGFTTAQAQYYGSYSREKPFPTEGLPAKYEEDGRQKYAQKEQLYIPRTDKNYYASKQAVEPGKLFMDRPRGYVPPGSSRHESPRSAAADQRFEVRVTPLSSANSSYSAYQSPSDPYSSKTYSDRNANRDSPKLGSSAYQDHSDSEVSVPVYGARSSEKHKYPEPAESRLVYTSPQNANFGYAQSRPTGQSPPPPPPQPLNATSQPYSQYKSRSESPTYRPPSPTYQQQRSPDSPKQTLERPYQLMPTMEGGLDASHSSKESKGKEEEVDALTSLLMQNMEAAADPDFFGYCARCGRPVHGEYNALYALETIYHPWCFNCERCGMCAKCGRAIMGETAGCKALDQLFHVDCFTCISCSTCLKGQPFYAMEGRPYCEPCYVTTLEKCSVCSKPITERILRATGKPYHPLCFKCVVCGKSLDGVPFTVDATNQIHCIDDFHRKFAPRCCVCDLPIMPQEGNEEAVRIVAMDKSFHPHCYKCEDCDVVLTSEADGRGCYPLDDHMLCKRCNARRIQHMTNRMPTEL